MSAWVTQVPSQVAKHGKDKASWYVKWDEPDGSRRMKSCGPGKKGKRNADRMAERIEAEILTGTYNRTSGKLWTEFRKEYDQRVLAGLGASTRLTVKISLDKFTEVLNLKNKTLEAISPDRLAEFVAARRTHRGMRRGSKVSPATINRDLRHIKAALRQAHEWEYIERVPRFRLEKEPKTLKRYITPEHFADVYAACDGATEPAEFRSPPDWWRGLFVMAQMTGWRISELLALQWKDVDLDAGTAFTRAEDNKGGRDETVRLHPVVIAHLRPLVGFQPNVFPYEWTDHKLLNEFHAIQERAGIDLSCQNRRTHECCVACHRYSFHAFRRSFATMNAENMTREALQALMRHKSASTTAIYIDFARQMKPAVANLHVPEVLKKAAGAEARG